MKEQIRIKQLYNSILVYLIVLILRLGAKKRCLYYIQQVTVDWLVEGYGSVTLCGLST